MHHKGSGHVTNFLVSRSPKQYRLSFYKNSELFLTSSNSFKSAPAQHDNDNDAERKLEIFASAEQGLELKSQTIVKLKGIKRHLLNRTEGSSSSIGLKDFLFAEILNKNLSITQHSIRTNSTFDMHVVAITKRIVSQVRFLRLGRR
jgi:hypothetical protein